MKAPKPSRSNQKASTRVGWSAWLGVMVGLLMGNLPHLLQAIHQCLLAFCVSWNLVVRTGVLLNLIILIILPCCVQPVFGGVGEMNANTTQGRLNLGETTGANFFQSHNLPVHHAAQCRAESFWENLLLINDGIKPSGSNDMKIRSIPHPFFLDGNLGGVPLSAGGHKIKDEGSQSYQNHPKGIWIDMSKIPWWGWLIVCLCALGVSQGIVCFIENVRSLMTPNIVLQPQSAVLFFP